MRKYLWGIAILVATALVVVAGVVTGKIDNPLDRAPKPGPSNEAIVDKNGGTFTFPEAGNIVVTVPKGAVNNKTTLTVGGVTPLRASDPGPLTEVRSGGVKFDVALTQGDKEVQPASGKPLGLQVPLAGTLLPAGSNPQFALPYSPGKNDKGYQLVPFAFDEKHVMRASLTHLSPKWVTFVSDEKLLDEFRDDLAKRDPASCKQELTVDGEKLKIGGDKTYGWSLDKSSPLLACLQTGSSDRYVRVGLANQLYYIMSLAATDNVRIAPAKGDAEEEIVKHFADTLFPDDRIDAYVGRNSKAVGSIDINTLPATIQLRGDPNTFLAEGVWTALKMLGTLITGETGNKTAERLMRASEVISCLQNALTISDEELNMARVIDLAVSKCAQMIHEELSDLVDPFKRLGILVNIWGGLWDVVKTTRTAFDGIRMQLNNTISVHVSGPAPKIDTFVGEWFINGSQMAVRANGTGEYSWRAGPCGDSMCTGHVKLSFTGSDTTLTATVTSKWFTRSDGSTAATAESDGQPFWKVGYVTTFERQSDTLIKRIRDDGGNPNMCRLEAPPEEGILCGIA